MVRGVNKHKASIISSGQRADSRVTSHFQVCVFSVQWAFDCVSVWQLLQQKVLLVKSSQFNLYGQNETKHICLTLQFENKLKYKFKILVLKRKLIPFSRGVFRFCKFVKRLLCCWTSELQTQICEQNIMSPFKGTVVTPWPVLCRFLSPVLVQSEGVRSRCCRMFWVL